MFCRLFHRITRLNDMSKKATRYSDGLCKASPCQERQGIYGFFPVATGSRPTQCFLGPCSPDLSGQGMIKFK